MEMQSFYAGHMFDAYTQLGALVQPAGGVLFRTFAPNAARAGLLLNGRELPMNQVYDGNFYELFCPQAGPGDAYEYRLYHEDGGYADHCDPFGFGMELRPAHRSIVRALDTYTFDDDLWMRERGEAADRPLNIYELHLGSWRRKPDGDWYNYRELVEPLARYLKESGYNYVEFLPLSEHPSDESWGYQNTGFFAPTSRYGTAADLMALVDGLHHAGIGAIMDFVPVHFAVDAYGLARYDGTTLYEYPSPDVGVSEWGSCNFLHARGWVRSFLQSAAHYWLSVYHFDGLRFDAVSRLIYWQGDEGRGENLDAIEFLRAMNAGLHMLDPGCMLIAEDSTSYPGVTRPAAEGGLGFTYKWCLGWMHDVLEYFQAPPWARSTLYHKLTFSMMYYYNERYLLPFSHDEGVHGKATILQKMHGDYEGKFPQGRVLYLWMMLHPGKKLNFMGGEIGQLREWDEKREQDWDLRRYPLHDSFYAYIRTLNGLYLDHPAFWARDCEPAGFQWLACNQERPAMYAFERRGGGERLAAVFNMCDIPQAGYTVAVPEARAAEVLLYTDWHPYSGQTPVGGEVCRLQKGRLTCDMAPYSAVLLLVK